MKVLNISRKLHKWLMLFLGIQFVIWSVSGAYMVILDIDYIHGDSLIENHQQYIDSADVQIAIQDIIEQYPQAHNIELGLFLQRTVYRFKSDGRNILVDATTGQTLPSLSETQAIAVARHFYRGEEPVLSTQLITDNPPFELGQRALPAWRINFDAFASPSIYVSAQSGAVVTKRHQFWRIFDWMFSFHVMDYKDEEVDNWLLFVFSLFGILAGVSGVTLVYFRIFRGNANGNTSIANQQTEVNHVID